MERPLPAHTAPGDAIVRLPDAARQADQTARPATVVSLIWAVALGGVVATALVAVDTGPGTHGPMAIPSLHGWLPLLLLGVTAVCDFVEVRLRHGDETEALTLFEAASRR